MLNKMAVVSYCLVGVLLLTALVSGQGDLLASEPQLELLNGKVKIDTGVLRPLVDSMTKNPYLCTACENFVQFLRNATDNQQLLAELVTLLLPVCDLLPYSLHEGCLGAVREIPTLVKMYTNVYLDPKIDCALLCAASRMAYAPNPAPLKMDSMTKNPYLCTGCENFVQFLRNATDNQQLLAELVTLLLPVCDLLPYSLHEGCLGVVREIPTLVKMYTNVYLDPKKDCALLCAASRMAYAPNPVPLTVNDLMQMMIKKPAKQ